MPHDNVACIVSEAGKLDNFWFDKETPSLHPLHYNLACLEDLADELS